MKYWNIFLKLLIYILFYVNMYFLFMDVVNGNDFDQLLGFLTTLLFIKIVSYESR